MRLVGLEVDAQNPERLAEFWAAMLGRRVDSSGRCLPGLSPIDFEVRLVREIAPKGMERHRMHPDLTSGSDDEQAACVERALRLGGHHVDVGQCDDEGHVVLGDPEGNEFCVIESGNGFLTDTA